MSNKQKIYIISNDLGLYKIGISKNVKKRCSQIEYNSGVPTKIEYSYLPKTCRAAELERTLHLKYQECRSKGEWFHLKSIKEVIIDIEGEEIICTGERKEDTTTPSLVKGGEEILPSIPIQVPLQPGFLSVPKEVLTVTKVNGELFGFLEKAIYSYLWSWCKENSEVYPSIKKICQDLGISSRTTVINQIKNLEERGLLRVDRGGGNHSSRYKVLPLHKMKLSYP